MRFRPLPTPAGSVWVCAIVVEQDDGAPYVKPLSWTPDGLAAVGIPTMDLLNSMIYVGTAEGVIYGVSFPLP